MSWLRKLNPRRIIYNKIKYMNEIKRHQFLAILRVTYFFATSSLLFYAFSLKSKFDKQEQAKKDQERLEAGYPVIQDESDAHESMRKKGVEAGVMYKYSKEKGWHIEEYHRDEYLSRLQKKAFEDARLAQLKAVEEGRELPPDAILLIDESGSS